MIYGLRKGFGPEDSGYRKISRRRDSASVWRGRSADLKPPGDYQLSVGGENDIRMAQSTNPSQKLQERSDLKKSKSDEGGLGG